MVKSMIKFLKIRDEEEVLFDDKGDFRLIRDGKVYLVHDSLQNIVFGNNTVRSVYEKESDKLKQEERERFYRFDKLKERFNYSSKNVDKNGGIERN